MKKFEVFEYLNDAVMVVNDSENVVYSNNMFKNKFQDFKTLKIFSHKVCFADEFCALESDNEIAYSPIMSAIASCDNFNAIINYANSQTFQRYYFKLYAFKRSKYTVFIFSDITNGHELTKYKTEYNKLNLKLREANEKVKTLEKSNNTLQTKAIKLSLTNKISNIIREDIDVSKILNSALRELVTMLSATRAYYAELNDKNFIITEVTSKHKENYVGKIVEYDEGIYNKILKKETISSPCVVEYKDAEPFKVPITRIILPVYHLNQLLGVIVILCRQKYNLTEEIDVLESVSAQLGNAIMHASLYEQVKEQKDELQKALKELKETQLQLIHSEKMASLGQLVAGVAHEINTPIGSIKSNNSVMAKMVNQIEDKEIAEIFEDAINIDKIAIDRINKLVTSLKKFVRLDEAELQEADINNELDITLELVRHETKNRIEVIKNYSELPKIKCYPNILNQVFMNILVNACQAIEGNGKITITTAIKNDSLHVTIKDTGKGIKKENFEKIFNAGFTTKGVGVGSGLGLAICSKIIEKHNGKIAVNSVEDKGSEFIITIPVINS